MVNTKVTLCGVKLDNPVIPASGTFGYGYEFAELYDINLLGTFSFKGTTLAPRYGNPTPRIAEYAGGLLNAVGLQNPGVEAVIREELPRLREVFHKPVMANVSGFSIEEYAQVCRQLDGKTFLVEEAKAGENLPPMHPFCRSITVPVTNNRTGTRWARDPVTGKSMTVPADMTYSKWYEKYVEKKGGVIRGAHSPKDKDDNQLKPGKPVHLGRINLNSEAERNAYVDRFIDEYGNAEYEYMLVVDSKGDVSLLTSKLPDMIDMTDVDITMKGSYNIHNHPAAETQFSFSDDMDVPYMLDDGTKIMEAFDYKYRYRLEQMDGVTKEQWVEARSQAEENVLSIMQDRGLDLSDYEEYAKHILIEESCRILGKGVYTRWKR